MTVAATSGVYRCEVSAEETFETHYRELNITVLGKIQVETKTIIEKLIEKKLSCTLVLKKTIKQQ